MVSSKLKYLLLMFVLLIPIGFSPEIYYYHNLTTPVNVTLANESTRYVFDEDYPSGTCASAPLILTSSYQKFPVSFYEYPVAGDSVYLQKILKSDFYITFPNPSTTYSFIITIDLRLSNGTDYLSFNTTEFNATSALGTKSVRLANATINEFLEPNSTIVLTPWIKHSGAGTRDIILRFSCANYPSNIHILRWPITSTLNLIYSTPVKVGSYRRIKASYVDYENVPISGANVTFYDGVDVIDGVYNSSSQTYDIYYLADSIGTHAIDATATSDIYNEAQATATIDVYNGFYTTVELFTDINYTYDNVTYGSNRYINNFGVVWFENKSACDYFGQNCRRVCFISNYKDGIANVTIIGSPAIYTLKFADGEIFLNDTSREDECPIVYNSEHTADFGQFMIVEDTEIKKKYNPDTDANIDSLNTKKPSTARFNIALALLVSAIGGAIIGFLSMSGFGFLAGFFISFLIVYFIGIQFIIWIGIAIFILVLGFLLAPLFGPGFVTFVVLAVISLIITAILMIAGVKIF